MILLLNTSTPLCQLFVIDGEARHDGSWEAGRELAHGLLANVSEMVESQGKTLHDLAGIGIYQGPGSFTGLRIGLTVANTLADGINVPIVGVSGDSWQSDALARLQADENDRIVLPDYGGDANITTPRK